MQMTMKNAIFRAIVDMDRAMSKNGAKVQELVTEAVKNGDAKSLTDAAAAFEKAIPHDPTARNAYLSVLRTRIERANITLGQPLHTVKKIKGAWTYTIRTETARKADPRAPLRRALSVVLEAAREGDSEVLAALVQALQPPMARAA